MGEQMKVKISYTTDISNIPSEVERIVGTCKRQIGEVYDLLSSLEASNVESIDKIDKVRHNLNYIDLLALDLSSIISGFIDASSKIRASKEDGE